MGEVDEGQCCVDRSECWISDETSEYAGEEIIWLARSRCCDSADRAESRRCGGFDGVESEKSNARCFDDVTWNGMLLRMSRSIVDVSNDLIPQ